MQNRLKTLEKNVYYTNKIGVENTSVFTILSKSLL